MDFMDKMLEYKSMLQYKCMYSDHRDVFMYHKSLINIVIFISLFASHIAFANPKTVEVQLVQLEAKKTTDRTSDKLYFTITEYPSAGEPRLLREPMYPLHWLFRDLPEIKQVKLWHGDLAKNQSVLLVFSLMEQDFPMFGTDDVIGSVQVKIINKDNKIHVVWGLPHFVDQPKVEKVDAKLPKFMMFGDDSKYLVAFKVVH